MCFGGRDLDPLASEVCRVPAQRRVGSGSSPDAFPLQGSEPGSGEGSREQFPGIS